MLLEGLITGAVSGIGAACACLFVEEGALTGVMLCLKHELYLSLSVGRLVCFLNC